MENKYLYLLTKIEHKDFFEDETFNLKTGFSVDKNRFFKSCLISFELDEEQVLNINTIRIFLDNKANYWHDSFLEIMPVRQDDKNTTKLFAAMDHELKKIVYKKSRYDYLVYRNHLLGYVKSHERIDYEELMKQVFINSVPENINDEIKKSLIESLNILPEIRGFDRQFNCVPNAIKARTINKSFQLNTGIELIIKDYMPDEMRCISIENEADGTTYLKVQTNDNEVIKTFPKFNRV
ncbi:hypothetical protein KPL37_07020 [Clostridium frigoris]|uniref:Uncharacterized protein n=1 Tax=Clostridium frigoris TaxID=205327 RepID=A0ABS6BRG0_9CLOT|nr:hypothetical protein [Clostridium frigoris]MBU3159506.1 hypothetical protein [Clostridium frigoris]